MKVTVHGGAGEIGGNKILLEDGDARIWLDMGQSFNFASEYVTQYLGLRDRFGLKDYFALDLVPKIPGLYSKEMLDGTGFPYRSPDFSGVLFSHAHFDHTRHLVFADPEIPVYLGEGTHLILEAWAQTSKDANIGEHKYRKFRSGKRLVLDGVEARPIHVDHSVPAAYGYVIHCPHGTVVYTGDLRRHGPHAEMTDEFIAEARQARPDILVCEGTRVDPADKKATYSEKDVRELSTAEVRRAKGKLAIATYYPRDVDRMRTFYQVARATGRDFVLSAKAAHLLLAMEKDGRISVPHVQKDDGILVYFRELEKPWRWEAELRGKVKNRAVGADYIRRHQGDVLLQLDTQHFAELVDIQPRRGSIFIHSMSEPFEENDVEEEVKNNWLRHFALVEHQLHASGHLSRADLVSLVKEIGAKKVVPVHTEKPELFRQFAGHVVIPEKGKTLFF